MFNQGEKVKSDVTVVVAQGKIFPTLNSDQCWYQCSKKIKSIKLDFENHVFLFFLMVHDHFSGCGIFNFELVYNILFPADVWPTLHVHLVWPRATNILISKYFDNNKYLQQIFSFQPMPEQLFLSIWVDPVQQIFKFPNISTTTNICNKYSLSSRCLTNSSCPSGLTPCKDLTCVPTNLHCNGKIDCT